MLIQNDVLNLLGIASGFLAGVTRQKIFVVILIISIVIFLIILVWHAARRDWAEFRNSLRGLAYIGISISVGALTDKVIGMA